MKAKQFVFEAYQDKVSGWWRWRLTYGGKVVAVSGSTYTRPHSALHAAVKTWQSIHLMLICPPATIIGSKYHSKTSRAQPKAKPVKVVIPVEVTPITLSSLIASLPDSPKRGKAE